MIARPAAFADVQRTLALFPICAILGPRQCGKTTLARGFPVPAENYFDLENLQDLARLQSPLLALESLPGLVVLDEVQRKPDLFPTLRVLADRWQGNGRFLILGSASPDLVRGVSESLAGRVGFVEIGGFSLGEIGAQNAAPLWLRGGFPRAYLAPDDAASYQWRQAFIQTFLTRDIPQYGIRIAPENLRRFWIMLAHYHGQTWNASEIAASLGVSYKTAQHYLEVLCGSFMVRTLTPWFENVGKRLRRSPKLYLRDSGLFHALLSIRSRDELLTHPKLGASWEGFALEQVFAAFRIARDEAFYYAAHGGAELDLLLFRGGRRIGFETKYTDSPAITPSIRSVLGDLRLDRLFVVYPGTRRYPLSPQIEVLPLADLFQAPPQL